MLEILNTMLPVFALIVLGYALAARRFLSKAFLDELNRLLFWVCLPALILHSMATAESLPAGTVRILALFWILTLLLIGLAWAAARLLQLPRNRFGAFVQAAFRGNLAYVGIPILTFAVQDQGPAVLSSVLTQTALVFAPTMLLYNLASVALLEWSRRTGERTGLSRSLRSIGRNPLVLASAAGALLFLAPFDLPGVLVDSLDFTGQIAAPASLLCVGGGMAYVSIKGRYRSATVASLIKVLVSPLLAFVVARLLGVEGQPLLVLMVLSACPTAVASYIMAKEMEGDEALASGAIVISTLLCIPGLALCLALV